MQHSSLADACTLNTIKNRIRAVTTEVDTLRAVPAPSLEASQVKHELSILIAELHPLGLLPTTVQLCHDRTQQCNEPARERSTSLRPHEYTQEVLRTYAGTADLNEQLTLSALGLAGETGEVADHLKKVLFQGHPLDKPHLVEEIGDLLWYLTLACHALEVSLDEVMQANVDKLRMRYPHGFESERSRNR